MSIEHTATALPEGPINTPLRFQFGDTTVSVIVDVPDAGQEIEETLPALTPEIVQNTPGMQPHFATADGRLKARVQGFLIERNGKKILIDTCVGDRKERSGFPRWNNLETEAFIKNLAKVGVTPDDITHVFCTHFHQDHVGWNTRLDNNGAWVPTFRNARYLLSATERDFWSGLIENRPEVIEAYPDVKRSFDDSIRPLYEAGLVDHVAIKTGRALIPGCSWLTAISTPGHTPDHASVLLTAGDLKIVFVGDAFHHPAQFTHHRIGASGDTDAPEALFSRLKLIQRKADIYFGPHFGGTGAVTLYKGARGMGKGSGAPRRPTLVQPFPALIPAFAAPE